MKTKYLFSDPQGDIPLGPIDLAKPFKISPSKDHPFLTLGDYFEAIKKFVLKDQTGTLTVLLGDRSDKSIRLDHIDTLQIRSEKHGALYHLASVEIVIDGQPLKYGVSTAISNRGKIYLNHEYDVLNYIEESFNLPYLPKVFFKGEIEIRIGDGQESLSMFLAEWFEDFHEWHISKDEKTERQRICIWNQKDGLRFASTPECLEIYKQASKILTLFYNTQNFSQIYPWHHAAGDFVVRTGDGNVEVKLTTARNYEPVMGFQKEEEINPMVALVYFFLNLTIKMRLDKWDGVGDAAWAEDFVLPAVMGGFFEGLKIKEEKGSYHPGKVDELPILLKAFAKEELKKMLCSLLELYLTGDPHDLAVIETHLESHAEALYLSIRNFNMK